MSARPYAFGDSAVASRRLAALASVFAPTSAQLLSTVAARRRGGDVVVARLAVDLGCGPGHTTALLADTLGAARVVGIDASAAFAAEARARAAPRCHYVVADVAAPALPVRDADVVYARFVLAHLAAPDRVLTRWSEAVVPGGVVVLEEPERIDTDDGDFRRYLELATAVVAARGADLFVGARLARAAPGRGWTVLVDGDAELDVTAGAAAAMFAPNLATWGNDPALAGLVRSGEAAALEERLWARTADDATGVIRWHVRQVVREAPG